MNSLLQLLQQKTPEEQKNLLAGLEHSALYQARGQAPQQMQGLLAPYEHRAFAREATTENPLMALPIAAGTLAWPAYKALVSPGRSAPSMNQVGQGLLGVGEGLMGYFRR